jgi:putative addiction module component (TIGR02574 family)
MQQTIAELVEASEALPIEERIELVQAIWDRIPTLPVEWRPSSAALAEIRRRRDEHAASPETAISSNEMWSRLDALRTR